MKKQFGAALGILIVFAWSGLAGGGGDAYLRVAHLRRSRRCCWGNGPIPRKQHRHPGGTVEGRDLGRVHVGR